MNYSQLMDLSEKMQSYQFSLLTQKNAQEMLIISINNKNKKARQMCEYMLSLWKSSVFRRNSGIKSQLGYSLPGWPWFCFNSSPSKSVVSIMMKGFQWWYNINSYWNRAVFNHCWSSYCMPSYGIRVAKKPINKIVALDSVI